MTRLTSDEYKQLTGNITEVLETHQQLLSLLELEANKPSHEQKVGKLFLTWAPRIKSVHQKYCSLHPRAVCILDKYRDELTKYMESKGAANPGVLVLTTMLSKPFRRLEKYSGMQQELERHVEESHPDRGDTQRSVSIYKDIAGKLFLSGVSVTRLEDTDQYKNAFEIGAPMIDKKIAVCQSKEEADRWVELIGRQTPRSGALTRFQSDESFVFETVVEGEISVGGSIFGDTEPLSITEVCFDSLVFDGAVGFANLVLKPASFVESISCQLIIYLYIPATARLLKPDAPSRMNHRGYCNRTSVLSFKTDLLYRPTYPPDHYPSAAPFAALTKYFQKLIRQKVITRKLLKQLLYSEYLNKMNLSLVRIRHHKTEISIVTKDIHCRDSIINCDSDSDSDSSESDSSDSDFQSKSRKDSESLTSSSSSNPFGYIRYYNPQTASESKETKYESFIDHALTSPSMKPSKEPSKLPSVLVSTANIQLTKQYSEESEASSFFPEPKAYMACENLPNLKGSLELNHPVPNTYVPTTRQSCPTKLVGNKFNQSSLTTIYIPTWSSSDNNIACKKQLEEVNRISVSKSNSSTTTHSSTLELPVNTLPLPDKVLGELLYGEFARPDSAESSSDIVIEPPTMFAKNDVKLASQSVSLNLEHVGFRKHSINSDKPRRRSSLQINPRELKKCVSSQYIKMSNPSFCQCCMEHCHSPRSSDSGMAGSYTLNSPDSANMNDNDSPARLRASMDLANRFHNYGDKLDGISLSEIEARDFESECPCTSPFGSTPRTSGQDFVPENVLTGSQDSLRPSVTSSIDLMPRLHSKVRLSDRGPLKSQSAGCLLDETIEDEEEGGTEEDRAVYRSGLYAHWWLKAKIPASVVKGIYMETRSPATGKGKCWLQCIGFVPCDFMSPLVARGPTAPLTSPPPNRHQAAPRSTTPSPHSRPAPSSTRADWSSGCPAPSSTRAGWSSVRLRPTPPLRPCFALGATPNGPYSRGGRQPTSYKEDGLILDVIEVYCSAMKARGAVNSVLARSRSSSSDLDRSSAVVARPVNPQHYRPHARRASTWCCGSFVARQLLRKTQHLD
ncbi:unnamed protein product [Phaedon cochleariae]|uniref:DH domain-containing protein n=1 Tax=Phaedon cochleariae TaxID=80249 RepID=A0A9N9S9Y3_PHACE|nr:unnamed protein product [Phaedon cochleariae]